MSFGERLKALAHNKKALAGVGIAAGLGLVVAVRRRKAGTAPGTTSQASDSSQPYVQPSYPSSSGTDVAGALGNMDSQYASEVAGYQAQLSAVQTALAGLQTNGSAITLPDTSSYNPQYVPPGSTTPTYTGSGSPTTPLPTTPTPTQVDTGNAGAGQGGVTVPATPKPAALLPSGYGWFATGGSTYTADSIARRYGISVSTLAALNPGLKIKGGSTVVSKNLPVKVRSNAGPWNLAAYRKVNHIG